MAVSQHRTCLAPGHPGRHTPAAGNSAVGSGCGGRRRAARRPTQASSQRTPCCQIPTWLPPLRPISPEPHPWAELPRRCSALQRPDDPYHMHVGEDTSRKRPRPSPGDAETAAAPTVAAPVYAPGVWVYGSPLNRGLSHQQLPRFIPAGHKARKLHGERRSASRHRANPDTSARTASTRLADLTPF